ncbi:MAG TPA: matrixin family metalloprotease, partial [Thermoanaerobaculia bacterium]|nr:matrixin family metalloprotease [Thermoanaerobaculia bacterium]
MATIIVGTYNLPAADAQSPVRYDDLPDLAEYVVDGRKWGYTNLTYFFQNGTSDISGDGGRQAIRDAFALWANVTPLTFTEVSSASSADIVIRWAVGDHGDGSPFDGVNGVLAHAFYPPPNGGSLAGDAHFDDSETWTLGLRSDWNQPIDLVTVAAHEIGHSLGLGHSQVPGALMYAFYGGSHRFLDPDDVAGIQSLYPTAPNPPGYVGCFTDNENRALPYWLGQVND